MISKPVMARGKRKVATKKPAWDDDEDSGSEVAVVAKPAPIINPVATVTEVEVPDFLKGVIDVVPTPEVYDNTYYNNYNTYDDN